MTPATEAALTAAILDEIDRVVVAKRDAVRTILLGVLAGGHILIEDRPGLGKTLIAKSLAAVLGLSFRRIQFTPDLLPADITGAVYLDPASSDLRFRAGPVFTQLLLADEINRATPKTQSALLEAMAEHHVTADGHTHQLPEPFIVPATDNPTEYDGTYPLPEAQLDRFTLRVTIGYLPADDEVALLLRHGSPDLPAPDALTAIADADRLAQIRAAVTGVEADRRILTYIVDLLTATRQHPRITVGASPRAGLDLLAVAKAHALLEGRDYVLPDDVKVHTVSVLGHRLTLTPEMWVRDISATQILTDILAGTAVPGGPGTTPQPDPRPDGRTRHGVARS